MSMTLSQKSSQRGLLVNAFGAVALALITNGLIFAVGWGSDNDQIQPSFAPPGWAIGSIWVVLFALMGSSRWLTRENSRAKNLITLLIVACLLYPFYTGGLQTQAIALIGTLITIAIGLFAVVAARKTSEKAALLITPVLLWSTFATAIIIEGLRLN